jgi:hypothetical protein
MTAESFIFSPDQPSSFRDALLAQTRNPDTWLCSGFRVRSLSDKIDVVNFAQSSRPGMTVWCGTYR